jgi:hypothetical protein
MAFNSAGCWRASSVGPTANNAQLSKYLSAGLLQAVVVKQPDGKLVLYTPENLPQ